MVSVFVWFSNIPDVSMSIMFNNIELSPSDPGATLIALLDRQDPSDPQSRLYVLALTLLPGLYTVVKQTPVGGPTYLLDWSTIEEAD